MLRFSELALDWLLPAGGLPKIYVTFSVFHKEIVKMATLCKISPGLRIANGLYFIADSFLHDN